MLDRVKDGSPYIVIKRLALEEGPACGQNTHTHVQLPWYMKGNC